MAAMPVYTIEEVADHNRADDFWTVVDGEVYDLTNFHRRHPGGKLIMAAAGSDCTIMFHTYHFEPDRKKKVQKVLSGFKIGTYAGKSQNMGAFYSDASATVADALKDEPKYPLRGQLLLALDMICLAMATMISLGMTSSTPLWVIVPIWCMMVIFGGRINQQNHAVGHVSVVRPWLNNYVELVLFVLGGASMAAYSQSDNSNMRKMCNKPRSKAQYEFTGARGPHEHQALHHVKGASLEHDQCALTAARHGAVRLSPDAPFKWVHKFQAVWPYYLLVSMRSALALGLAAPFVRLNMGKYYAKAKEWPYAVCSVLGAIVCVAQSRMILMPLCHGTAGFLVFFLLMVTVARSSAAVSGTFFFAQHMWDRHTDEADVTDWGVTNAYSTYSFWPDMPLHPLLWLAPGGACPSTLTYHLEHTLFPGLNYLHLPKAARAVEQVCAKHGLEYNKIEGCAALDAKLMEFLIKYSKEPEKKVN